MEAILDNEREDKDDISQLFSKKIVTLYTESHIVKDVKVQEFVNLKNALPSSNIGAGGFLSDEGVCDRALATLFQKLNKRKHRREKAFEQKKRDFVKRCTKMEEKWKNEDEESISALNLPKLSKLDMGWRRYRPQSIDTIYCSPDYPITRKEMARKYKPDGFNIVLPMMTLQLEKTEVLHVKHRDKMYITKTPVMVDVDKRQLGRHHRYCGADLLDRSLPKNDERFLGLSRQLSELPWNRKKSVFFIEPEKHIEKDQDGVKNGATSPRARIVRKWATPLTMKPIQPKVPKEGNKQELIQVKEQTDTNGEDPNEKLNEEEPEAALERSDNEDRDVQEAIGDTTHDTESVLKLKCLSTMDKSTRNDLTKSNISHHETTKCDKESAMEKGCDRSARRVKIVEKPVTRGTSCAKSVSRDTGCTRHSPSVKRSPSRGTQAIIRDVRTKQWKDITKEYGIGLLRKSCDGDVHRPRTHVNRHRRCHFPSLRREHTVT